MLRRILIPFLCLLGLFCTLQAQDAPGLKIAALHPILGDMARAIGGSHVQVADLLRPNGNLHSFEPAPQDIAAAGQARLVLASGKNLEPYLPKLKDALGVAADTADHDHGHDGDCCAHGPNDPHWWHTPANMKRAARALAAALTRMDPAHEQDYKAGLARWNRKMDQLSSWARKELADIPEADRILVTGHAAMNHFCKEFGFRSISIQGVSREDEGNSAQLASTLKKLRAAGVKALLPSRSIPTGWLRTAIRSSPCSSKTSASSRKPFPRPPGHDQHTPAPVFPYSGSRHPAGVLPL